jgi:hypothetical protein
MNNALVNIFILLTLIIDNNHDFIFQHFQKNVYWGYEHRCKTYYEKLQYLFTKTLTFQTEDKSRTLEFGTGEDNFF